MSRDRPVVSQSRVSCYVAHSAVSGLRPSHTQLVSEVSRVTTANLSRPVVASEQISSPRVKERWAELQRLSLAKGVAAVGSYILAFGRHVWRTQHVRVFSECLIYRLYRTEKA